MSCAPAVADVDGLQSDESQTRHETWESIFTSLTRLESGLQTVEANLGQLQSDLRAFRNALDEGPA